MLGKSRRTGLQLAVTHLLELLIALEQQNVGRLEIVNVLVPLKLLSDLGTNGGGGNIQSVQLRAVRQNKVNHCELFSIRMRDGAGAVGRPVLRGTQHRESGFAYISGAGERIWQLARRNTYNLHRTHLLGTKTGTARECERELQAKNRKM